MHDAEVIASESRIALEMALHPLGQQPPPLPRADDCHAVEDPLDPVQAHMNGLRRQLGGNYRDLTNHGNIHLATYVSADDAGGSQEQGGSTRPQVNMFGEQGTNKTDPRQFWDRVISLQRGSSPSSAGDAEHLLAHVPPVTAKQASELSELFEQERASLRANCLGSVPALDPSVDSPDIASAKGQVQPPERRDSSSDAMWVKGVVPVLSPMQQLAQAGVMDEDGELALLREMQSLTMGCPILGGPGDEVSSGAVEEAQDRYEKAVENMLAIRPKLQGVQDTSMVTGSDVSLLHFAGDGDNESGVEELQDEAELERLGQEINFRVAAAAQTFLETAGNLDSAADIMIHPVEEFEQVSVVPLQSASGDADRFQGLKDRDDGREMVSGGAEGYAVADSLDLDLLPSLDVGDGVDSEFANLRPATAQASTVAVAMVSGATLCEGDAAEKQLSADMMAVDS